MATRSFDAVDALKRAYEEIRAFQTDELGTFHNRERYEFIRTAICLLEEKPKTSLKRFLDRLDVMQKAGKLTEDDIVFLIRMIGDLHDALCDIAWSRFPDVGEDGSISDDSFARWSRMRAKSAIGDDDY